MYKHPILSYNRYKNEDARGYDIISVENQKKQNLDNVRIKHRDSTWDKIVENVDGKFKSFLYLNQTKIKMELKGICISLRIKEIL